MKKRSYALGTALLLTLVLTGCSAGHVNNTAAPSHSVYGSDDARSSDRIGGIDDGNDAFQGGGAGGTNDLNNDGQPDGGIGSDVGQAINDVGRDVVDGIDRATR